MHVDSRGGALPAIPPSMVPLLTSAATELGKAGIGTATGVAKSALKRLGGRFGFTPKRAKVDSSDDDSDDQGPTAPTISNQMQMEQYGYL
jgi:hypothetical protein